MRSKIFRQSPKIINTLLALRVAKQWRKRQGARMTNNDILRRLRYIKNYSDKQMLELFSLGGLKTTNEELLSWLKRDDHPDYLFIKDVQFAQFLNGLIIKYRGAREDNPLQVESQLTNNIILRKISIAFNLRSDDILKIMSAANFRLGKAELSAFFRKPGHKNYRECQSQVLRNFLTGLQNFS